MIAALATWYLSLAPASAPAYWRETRELERAQMEYDDEIAGGFLKWFPSLSLVGKDVLDLGCGYGGRTVRYAELGVRSVTGIEPGERQCSEGREFAATHGVTATFTSGAGECLPLPADYVDCIVCYDVLEHVSDPGKTLRECLRVLKSGGSLYAVFPPFYHPTGAHFDGWLSKMPWPNVLFPCRALVKAGTNILAQRADSYRPNALRPTDKLWGLNGITIRKLRQIARGLDADFRIDLAPLFSSQNRKWESWHMKYFAPLFTILRNTPILQECFTHRISLTMTKPHLDSRESNALRMLAHEDKLGRIGGSMLVRLQSAISLFTCGCLVCVAASPSSIGLVVTSGLAQIDGAVIHGNSTLFQGNLVQAGGGTSDLMFPGGSNLLLQPGSAVRVFREYAVLEHGAAIQRGSNALVADGLKVSSLSPQGAVFVVMQDASHLNVAAQGSAAEVRNPAGDLVARLEPGKAMSFAIQAAPPNSADLQQSPTPTTTGQTPAPSGVQLTVHGILHKDHPGRYGHFLLTDLQSKVTYELQGPGLDDLVGASVEVTGSTFDTAAAEGASKVLSVSDIHQMPLSEMPGAPTPPAPAPMPSNPAAAPPTPSGDTVPATGAGPEVGATPEATAPPEVNNAPVIPPLPQHSDTPKILLIVALAAGAVVGIALGLGGGKSSTVSPA